MDEPPQPTARPDLEPAAIIRVSSTSPPAAVAGAIAGVMRVHKFAEVQAVGPFAINQAVKAIAIATGYLDEDGIEIVCSVRFVKLNIDGQERTAIRFSVEPRP